VTTRSPPRLAAWLLEELGSNARLEELLGDLSEQFAAGRSRLWYWRQATGALLLDLRQGLRTHALSFLGAVLAGYAITAVWVFANEVMFGALYQSLDASAHPDSLMRFLGLRAAQASTTVLVFVSSWLVMRIHRAHPRAVLVTFVAAVIAPRLPGIAHLVIGVIEGTQSRSVLVPEIVRMSLQAVYTPLIGLWLIRRDRLAAMPPWIRFITVLTIILTLISALLYDLWQVGAIGYPIPLRYVVDFAEIACGAYLLSLLWRRESRSMSPKSVTGPAAAGSQA